jgi:fatty acid desaturase
MIDKPKPSDEQLARISLQTIPPKTADSHTRYEEVELESARLENQNKRQNINFRKGFSIAIFVLGCLWLAFIALVIIFQGFGKFRGGSFNLSQGVMLALIGTTTVNVLGLFYVVTNYLFPKKPH